MLSLRRRAMIGGVLSAMISILVGSFVLLSSIEDNVRDRFDRDMADRHSRVVSALNQNSSNPAALRDVLHDPAYRAPYSGRYWQITSHAQELFTSCLLYTSPSPRDRG